VNRGQITSAYGSKTGDFRERPMAERDAGCMLSGWPVG